MRLGRITTVAALGLGALVGLSGPPAQAGYTVTLAQVGSNVIATGSGTLDVTGLTIAGAGFGEADIAASVALIFTGPASPSQPSEAYTGFTGPTSFGSGGQFFASNGSGDIVGINGSQNSLAVPRNYVSGHPLSDSSTYDNQTFASLGVKPGTYVWTWRTDSFTLVIPAAAVPEPAGLLLLPLGLVGVVAARRYRDRG